MSTSVTQVYVNAYVTYNKVHVIMKLSHRIVYIIEQDMYGQNILVKILAYIVTNMLLLPHAGTKKRKHIFSKTMYT